MIKLYLSSHIYVFELCLLCSRLKDISCEDKIFWFAFQNKYGAIFLWKNGISFYKCWDIWLVPWEMFEKVHYASCVVLIDNFLKRSGHFIGLQHFGIYDTTQISITYWYLSNFTRCFYRTTFLNGQAFRRLSRWCHLSTYPLRPLRT